MFACAQKLFQDGHRIKDCQELCESQTFLTGHSLQGQSPPSCCPCVWPLAGDCGKEGGGAEGECERERALGCYYATALDIEVDPQRCCLDRRQSDFALQAVVECHMLELESNGSEVCLSLPVGL